MSILEDSFHEMQLVGTSPRPCSTVAELLAAMSTAARHRKTAATHRNSQSSRSHSICRITLHNPFAHGTAGAAATDGVLYVVDLAGSEAARDSSHSHAGQERAREAREINTSLSVLKDCIRGREQCAQAAAEGKGTPYIPFRQSALTKALKHVFVPQLSGGLLARQVKTGVLACVNPAALDVPASRNTLRYARMLRVDVPKLPALEFHPGVPLTWNNAQVREWIAKQVSSVLHIYSFHFR